MKTLVNRLVILFLIGSTACAAKHEPSLRITTATLATLLRAGVPMTVCDARTGKHDDGRRIAGAVSLAPDAAEEEIALRLTKGKDALVVTYCKDPECPNFAALAVRLRKLGYRNVLEDPEGIEGWSKAGLPVDNGPGGAARSAANAP